MIAESFGATHRSIANQRLTKTLLMGLGGSALLHTVAIAGVSYLAHNHTPEPMEIVEIERVEIEPERSIKPIIPIAKPNPAPEPKVVKPPIIAAAPTPIPVEIPTPKAIPTPPTVVKITKSAPSVSPLSNIVAAAKPVEPPAKIAAITPQKSNPSPSFPDRLFSTPPPKSVPSQPTAAAQIPSPKVFSEPPKIATQKIENKPPQSSPIKDAQPPTANNQTALAAKTKSAQSAPNYNPDPTDNSPETEELTSSSPGNTSKLARTPDRSISGNNQTSLAHQSKSPEGFGTGFGSIDNNTPASNDDFGGTPGNNTRIANNTQTGAPSSNNQTGLGSNPTKRSGLNPDFSNGGGEDNPNGSDENIGGIPGNNTRIARSNSGGKQQIGSNGNGDRNIAAGSKNQASIQCLRNCEIRYPDELETSDIGKDKMLVKVTIDPNGLVASAEIARSSGNQKLDQFTLDGIKQMQLNATGKTRTHKVKISTLLNN